MDSARAKPWQAAPTTLAPNGWMIWNALPVHGVTYGSGRFVAAQSLDGPGGQYSANGSEWFAALFSSPAGSDVAYGNGTFVSVGPGGFGGKLAISNDGDNWRELADPTTNAVSGVAFGNGRFVAVGESGAVIVSTNALDWRKTWSGTGLFLHRVGYGNGKFVAAGESGAIRVSNDGLSWAEAASGASEALFGVAYGEGAYLVVGNHGTILTSPDALTWTPKQSGTTNDLYGVAYGNDAFVVVGAQGTILESGVRPFSIRFKRVQAHPTGFETYLASEPGRSFRIETSTNLVHWSEASVQTQSKDGVLFLDAATTAQPQKFYRAVAP